MHFYRKNRRIYDRYNLNDKKILKDTCSFPFCNKDNIQEILYQNTSMYVIANRIPYDVFEGCRVVDHLMIIPKRHVETLADFTEQEQTDQMTIAGEYEKRGYGVYARGVKSITRSVDHQHTHLIRLGGGRPKIFIYLLKPYFLLRK